MDERKRRVLEALIDDYIMTAEPVGSRTLARKYHFGVSSATIRNEMADLEEWGFLEQPHTSAGRVPSDKGYRMYVDELMKPSVLESQLVERIRIFYQSRYRELQWFIHQTARLVSEITAYPSVVVAPAMEDARLADLSFVPVGPDVGLLVLRTDTGLIENQTLNLPDDIDPKELAMLAREFSQEFHGLLIREIGDRLLEPLSGDIKRYEKLRKATFRWLMDRESGEDRLTVAGPLNILNYPEFHDVDKVRRVLGFLEQQTALGQLLNQHMTSGVEIVIGTESSVVDIQDCSVVTATYQVGSWVVGRLLVLGPRRMQYSRVVAILETVSEELSHALKWA